MPRRLGQQPAALRIQKKKQDYLGRMLEMEEAWPRIAAQETLGEAFRFRTEFLAAIASL